MVTTVEEQLELLDRVLHSDWIIDKSLAIDGGAHTGTWTLAIARHFDSVIAFEPALDIFRSLATRTQSCRNVICRQNALLDRDALVEMIMPPKKSHPMSRYVRACDDGPVQAVSIDSLGLTHCGFIKLDLEGAELLALRGARKTIRRFRPTLMIEIDRYGERFGQPREALPTYIASLGYSEVAACRPDKVYVPSERAS